MALGVLHGETLRAGASRLVGRSDRCTWRALCWPALTILAIAGALAVYLHAFGLKTGLDATSSTYARYWYSLLAVEALVIPPTLFLIVMRLAKSRCSTCTMARAEGAAIAPEHELKHIWTHWSLLLAASVASNLLPGLFGSHDTAWHQATMRDTTLSPTHVPMFFAVGPLTIGMVVAALVYGRTRIPTVWAKGRTPMAYNLALGGWVLTTLFFGLNEFGHSQWIQEERLANAVHFPFLVAFWGTLALLSVALKSLPRVAELLRASAEPRALNDGA